MAREKPGDWIRWWHRKILSDAFVTRLPIAWEGAYRRLLDYNASEGSLPNDPEELALLAKMTIEEFKPCWKALKKKFSTAGCGRKRITNLFIARELAHQKRVSEARANAAKQRPSRKIARFPQKAIAQQLLSKSNANATEEEEEIEDQDLSTTAAGSEFSTNPQGDVWWTDSGELDCNPHFAEWLASTYPDVAHESLRKTFERLSRWLSRNPTRLRELVESNRLRQWVENRFDEDFAEGDGKINSVQSEANVGSR